jgi:hypothetical protein
LCIISLGSGNVSLQLYFTTSSSLLPIIHTSILQVSDLKFINPHRLTVLNMPSKDFIDVRVLVDGQPLVEYRDPDGEAEHEQKLTRYVEVKAGQKFKVRVTFLPGFEFRFAPFVFYKLKIDNGNTFKFSTVDYSACVVHKGTLGKAIEQEFTSAHWRDGNTGMWYDYDYEFGALGVGEQSNPLFRLRMPDHC